MPEIDLPPGKYRWRRPMNPWMSVLGLAMAGGVIAFVWWNRVGTSNEILLTAGMGIAAGLLIGGLLRNVD